MDGQSDGSENAGENEEPDDPDNAVILGEKYPVDATTELILNSKGLTDKDVVQIGKLVNLTELQIENNNITDISPLANLTALNELSIPYNKVSDVSVLEKLPAIKSLDIDHNDISDEDIEKLKEQLPDCYFK